MHTLSKGLAIACLLMGFGCLTEEMPPIFVQYMLGTLFFLIGLILWPNPWRNE